LLVEKLNAFIVLYAAGQEIAFLPMVEITIDTSEQKICLL
jgi:hypothetical protein